ncbi:MAG: glycoside hydrolase family 78 protein [Opitutaceae bacterium]|jgi:alpha-L-rhamnosidase|nr:glycoside hydrolase family 78 protein [Opitutaceae bacterium]
MFPKPIHKTAAVLLCGVLMTAARAEKKPAANGTPKARVTELRCEYRVNPEGIDEPRPRLSWQLAAVPGNDESVPRGTAQSAWRVLVAGSAEALARDEGDLWDSGWVASDQSIQNEYAGKALASRQACFWKARVRDRNGVETPWSEPARWSMGLLSEADWTARWTGLDEPETTARERTLDGCAWIGFAGGGPGLSDAPVARFYRKVFELPEGRAVETAVLRTAADNSFECWLNGERVSKGNGWRTARARTVTATLRPGKNTLAVKVENAGVTPNPAGLATALEVRFAGGDGLVVGTGADWRCRGRIEEGWEKAGFDDAAWPAARVLGKIGMAPWGAVSTGGDEERRLPARQARKEFATPAGKKVVRATLYASGLGLSEFRLNGEKIGDHVLSPGCTHYTKRVLYVTHDVTGKIRAGRNALAVWLGNGRFYAPRTAEPKETLNYGFPKFIAQLELHYDDGTREAVVSDGTWRLTDKGPILANNEYDGEEYDARREFAGWDSPGFDDSGWENARVVAPPGGALCAQMAEPIRVTGEIHPVAVTEPRPGVHVFDMGQNMVGWTRLKVRGAAGTVVRMRHTETLKDDGTLHMDNIRGAKVTGIYTLKGDAAGETYEPRFTYYGFRYVEVEGLPEKPGVDALTGRVVHDDVAAAGDFECSAPMVNAILRNVRWGVRGNYRSMPTDCPQRDERLGWLGDRSEESRGETYLFDIAALYSKWLQDMRDAQRGDGVIPDVCPPYWPLYRDNVTWPATGVIVPDMLRTHYGDTRVVARHYDAMARWIAHIASLAKDGIVERDIYGDWCVPPEEQTLIHSKDPARRTAPALLATSYYYHCLKLMARHARVLGKAGDAADYEARAAATGEAFNRRFFNAEAGLYDNGSQTSCVLPLAFGLVPEKERGRVFAHLAGKITGETRGHVGTGLIGGQWLNRVLSGGGRPDLPFGFATLKTYPSWGYMIEKGATTIWELWNGDTADPAMNSGNHVMLVGDLVVWLHENVGGIAPDPERPGFKHIRLMPDVVDGLEWARASHRSPHGLIRSEWTRRGGVFGWKVTIPANTDATLRIPFAVGAGKVTEGGKPLEAAPGVRLVADGADGVTLALAPGEYYFRANIAE